MRAVDLILKKRYKHELTQEEIQFFIDGYTKGEIPDYQAAAFAMAIVLNGMTPRETTDLTLAMANSGEVLDLSSVVPIAVDKHSTGGVGDKTTLVVEPTVAACGLPVGKMSGHGLGFSGGTLDKMESIPGFRTHLTTDEFMSQLKSIGLVLAGQTSDLAPADGKFYALRDVTGTVQSIPLIASSVMSKKIAAGAQAIVLDVKIGYGAFMKSLEEGKALSELMVSIAKLAGRKAIALLSDMNQPLGNAVGNTLELKEAIQTLHGDGPEDFLEHCLVVAGHMLAIGGITENEEIGKKIAQEAILDGRAWDRFRQLVKTQGGDVLYIDDPELLPKSIFIEDYLSPRSGYLAKIDAQIVGETAVLLGAGRSNKEDIIDYSVGIIVHNKVGDNVKTGDPIFTIHSNQSVLLQQAKLKLEEALEWSEQPVSPLPLFYGVIR